MWRAHSPGGNIEERIDTGNKSSVKKPPPPKLWVLLFLAWCFKEAIVTADLRMFSYLQSLKSGKHKSSGGDKVLEHIEEACFFFLTFSNEKEKLLVTHTHTHTENEIDGGVFRCREGGLRGGEEARIESYLFHLPVFSSFLFSVVLIQKLQFLAAASSRPADPQLSLFLCRTCFYLCWRAIHQSQIVRLLSYRWEGGAAISTPPSKNGTVLLWPHDGAVWSGHVLPLGSPSCLLQSKNRNMRWSGDFCGDLGTSPGSTSAGLGSWRTAG